MIVRDEERWITACLESVRGVVDEMIVVDTGSRDLTPDLAERCGARVYACAWNGYMDEVVQAKNKTARNLRLILESMRRDPDYDPWLDHHAASELYRLGRFDEALAFVGRAIVRFLERRQPPPSLVYRLKYAALIEAGRCAEAARGIDAALAMYPDYVDLHLYKGIILLHLDRTEEALAAFRHCLRLGDGGTAHLTCHGAGSFLAWLYIGRCLRRLGRMREAREAFGKALALRPDFPEARREMEACGNDHDQPVHDRQG